MFVLSIKFSSKSNINIIDIKTNLFDLNFLTR